VVPAGSVVAVAAMAVVVVVFERGHYRGCIERGYFDPAFLQVHLIRRTGT
jgi:hypothetical protein